MDIAQASLQLGLHLLETALQLDLLLGYFSHHLAARVTLAFIVISFVTANTTSAMLVYRNMVFSEGRRNGRVICIVVHILQVGPIWRYFKLVFTRERGDRRELTMLRVLQSTIQSAVYLSGLGFLWQSETPVSGMSLAALSVTVVSLTLAYVFHEVNWRAEHHLNSHQTTSHPSNDNPQLDCRNIIHLSLLCVSKLFILSSRCLAIFVMTAVAKLWIFLILFLHVIFSSVGLYIIRASSKQIVGTGLKDLLVNTFHLFDLIRAYEKNLGAELIYLRGFLFIESVAFLLIWFFITGTVNIHKEVFLIVTLSLLTLGYLMSILEIIHRHSCKLKSVNKNCMVFNIGNSTSNFHRSRLKEEPSPAHQIRPHKDNGTAPCIHENMNNHMNIQIGGRDQKVQTDQRDVVFTPPINYEHQHAFNEDPSVIMHIHPTVTSQREPTVGEFPQVTIFCDQGNLHDSGCSGSLGPGELSVSSGGYNTSGISVDPSQSSSHVTPTTSSFIHTTRAASDNTSTSVEFLELDLDPVYYIRPKEMDTVSMGNYRLIPEHRTVNHNQDQPPSWNDLGQKVQGRVMRNVRKFKRHTRSCKRRINYYSPASETTSSSDTAYPEYMERHGRSRYVSRYPPNYADSASSISTSSTSSYTTDTMDLIGSDDDFTMSWPPARKITIENVKNLPTERVNPLDHVSKWLDTTTAVTTVEPSINSVKNFQRPSTNGQDVVKSSYCHHGLVNCPQCRLRRLDGLGCSHKKPRVPSIKLREQERDYLRKTMYHHHRFGSPLPWATGQRQAKGAKKRHKLLELCCGGGTSSAEERPKALWPYNTDGLLA